MMMVAGGFRDETVDCDPLAISSLVLPCLYPVVPYFYLALFHLPTAFYFAWDTTSSLLKRITGIDFSGDESATPASPKPVAKTPKPEV